MQLIIVTQQLEVNMADLNTWAGLNAKNANNKITPTVPTVGPVKSALQTVGNAVNPLSSTNVVEQAGGAYNNFMSNLQSHITNMAGSAFNNLIVQPATRVAELGVQTANEFQNPGYDTAVDTGNPQRVNAGGTAGTPLPINAGVTPTNTSNSDANIQQPQTTLGQIVAPVKSLKQIAGEGLESASYLAAPELSEGAIGAPTLVGKVLAGAGSGYALGAAGGAGSDLANNPNSNFQTVTKSAQSGANQGGVVGGVLGGVGGAISGNGEAPVETPTPTEPQTNEFQDTLNSRIKDATPDYNANMVGKNVRTPDITDENGVTTKGKITPRIASEGEGLTGKRPVTTSASEDAAGRQLNTIKDYPDKGTALEKSLSAGKAISTEAEGLKDSIAEEDKINPLDSKAERAKVTSYVEKHLDPTEQEKFESGKSSKTAMGKYVSQVNEAVADYDGTRAGKLQLRQKLDDVYQEARGKAAFQSDTGNMLDETHTDIRNEINKDLKSSTQNTDTQASLDKQTKLYRAKDVLETKARTEANNELGRVLQRHPQLGYISRMLERHGIGIGLTAVGATGLGTLLHHELTK